MDPNDKRDAFADIPLSSGPIGFDPAEMTTCPRCGRTNPPNRLNCFYCSESFDSCAVDVSKVKVASRRLENWENGINVIAISSGVPVADDAVSDVARNTGIDPDALRVAAAGGSTFPLRRVESEAEASVVAANVSRIGLDTVTVPDAALASDNPPVRCRAIILGQTAITFVPFNTGTPVELTRKALTVIVAGTLVETKTEATEKRKGRKSTTEIESVTASETPVLDIYYVDDGRGLRIQATGFDFSCLGPEKEYIAARNLNALCKKLASFATEVKVVSDYDDLRKVLDTVWDVDERTDSMGLKRSGFGKTSIANVTTRCNLSQFTKYSRLHKYLSDQEKTLSSNG